ncbi:hypothetical protein NHX12_022339 [Muraenolepis orangiensis]|uniref:Uncharacterized protein n=1 Tax=Muraenolepis orangiensis TaxID=630683 RepID=A0A9Q0EN15_9TELE|nr:hypothetical protein NHX12_022339 [Muraenolepis orangiensis]
MMLNNMSSLPVSCGLPVANKTTEQANIVADSAVTGANEVAQATVDGVENAALASGLVKAADPQVEGEADQKQEPVQTAS